MALTNHIVRAEIERRAVTRVGFSRKPSLPVRLFRFNDGLYNCSTTILGNAYHGNDTLSVTIVALTSYFRNLRGFFSSFLRFHVRFFSKIET